MPRRRTRPSFNRNSAAAWDSGSLCRATGLLTLRFAIECCCHPERNLAHSCAIECCCHPERNLAHSCAIECCCHPERSLAEISAKRSRRIRGCFSHVMQEINRSRDSKWRHKRLCNQGKASAGPTGRTQPRGPQPRRAATLSNQRASKTGCTNSAWKGHGFNRATKGRINGGLY
jgi:hypothetical protein